MRNAVHAVVAALAANNGAINKKIADSTIKTVLGADRLSGHAYPVRYRSPKPPPDVTHLRAVESVTLRRRRQGGPMKRVYTLPFGVKPVLPRDLAVLAFRAPGIVALGDVGTDGLVRTICVDRDVPDVTFESRVYVEDVHVGAVYATTGTRVHVALRGVSTKHPDMWGWSRGEWDVATGEPL